MSESFRENMRKEVVRRRPCVRLDNFAKKLETPKWKRYPQGKPIDPKNPL